MADLSTEYMGLKISNPIVVASSPLTTTADKVARCEDAGAGAVVLASLFEEQIESDKRSMIGDLDAFAYADAYDLFQNTSENYYLDEYLKTLEETKARVDIPVIASLNCTQAGSWLEYAERFEAVGADALELNTFIMPGDVEKTGAEIEEVYLNIARSVRKEVKIPVSMKIGTHFSGMANIMRHFADIGIDALVVFNRFYRPDVDIYAKKLIHGAMTSDPGEMADSLRWVALMSGELEADMAATTGIHSGEAVVKQLLVGARAVYLASVLLNNGLDTIGTMKTFLSDWMDKQGYGSISDFNGMLCQESSVNPQEYERAQFIKALLENRA